MSITPVSPPPKFTPSPAPVTTGDWMSFFRWLKNLWQSLTDTSTIVAALPPPVFEHYEPTGPRQLDQAAVSGSRPAAPQSYVDTTSGLIFRSSSPDQHRESALPPVFPPVRSFPPQPEQLGPLTALLFTRIIQTSGGGNTPATPGTLFAEDETPSGAMNGVNQTYTLLYAPSPAISLELYFNGVLLLQGTDYTLTGSTIVLTNAKPNSANNEWLRAWYRYVGISGANFADDETPAGLMNGVNQIFTLANAPNPSTCLQLYYNGVLLLQGTDYTLSGKTITLTSAHPNSANNEWLKAWYRYGTVAASNFADDETPGGAYNGSNQSYTLASVPNPAASLELYFNGVLLLQGVDYTLAANVITLANAAPNSALNEWLRAWYQF